MTGNDRSQLSKNVRRISHLDIPGGGQLIVQGNYAYVGHMKPPHGTSIIDISDPGAPVYRDTTGDAYGATVAGSYA